MSQATRTLLLLGGLTLLAIGIGAYAWFGVQEPDEKDAAKKEHDTRLFAPEKVGEKNKDGGVVSARFVKLSITVGDAGTTVLERPETDGDWQLTQPLVAKADTFTVDQVTSQLQQQKFKQTVDEKPDDAALVKYGLKPPQFVVVAEAIVGEQKERRTARLEGGVENTFDGTVFMRRGDEPTVFSAEGGVRWALSKSTFDLRDKRVLAVDHEKVTRLELTSKTNKWTLERDAEKNWKLSVPPPIGSTKAPEPIAADTVTVTAMIAAVSGESASAFPDLKPEAFAAPAVDATFTLEDGKKTRLRFIQPDRTQVIREDEAGTVIAEVPNTAMAQLDKPAVVFRDKTVLPFKKELVQRVVFKNPDGKELIVERAVGPDGGNGEEWNLVAPEKGKAKPFKMASLLWVLGSLKINEVTEESPKDWSRYGLDPKSARSISLFGAGDKPLGQLLLGKEALGKLGNTYARGARDQAVAVDNGRLQDLPNVPADLLEGAAPADAGN